MMKSVVFALAFSACSLQWKNMRAPEDIPIAQQQAVCAKLDNQQLGWNVASITLGGLSGASGLTSIVVSDNQKVIEAMGGISLIVTVASAVSAFLAAQFTQRFCRQCANIVPPLVTP
jgi:hypothetical protein